MLEKLGMKTVETTTPWYTGKVRFDGIPLNKLGNGANLLI